IENPDDARVAEYAHVREPEFVRTAGLFVVEGRLIVERLIEDGRCTIRSLLVSPSIYRSLEANIRMLPPATPVYVCGASQFRTITGFEFHRGCLALAERPHPTAACEILRDASLLVVLDGVTNADNVGGVFRNAAAF